MKEYLTALQSIDRDALKAKAQVARELAGDYAQPAKAVAGSYAQQARAAAGEYAREARSRASQAAAAHAPRAEAFAENAKSAVRSLARDAQGDICDFWSFAAERMRGFSLFDIAVFKIVLVSFGLWLGAWLAAKFSKLTEKFRPVFFAMFLCGYVYLIYRIFFKDNE